MSDEIPNIPPIPDGLREAAQRGTLIPFIGAGASKLAGCPSWTEFADAALKYFISLGKFTHSQLDQMRHLGPRVKLSIARALEEEYKLDVDFARILHQDAALTHPLGRRLYDSLGRLGRTFVTTNYDAWLDTIGPPAPTVADRTNPAAAPTSTRRKIVYKVADIVPALLNQENTVIHLHGSMLEPRGMIMTTQNYVSHYANDRGAGNAEDENRILTFLDHLFSTRTVVFVGYGLEELEILEYVILKARRVLGGNPSETRHYLLQGFFSNQTELYRSLSGYYSKQCGVELLPYLRDFRDWGQLVEVMEFYAKEVPASSAIALQDFADMSRLLDG